jgi:hypothetical protein
MNGDIQARIAAKVEYDTNGGCWLWPERPVPGGYGEFWMDGGSTLVHRLSWTSVNGPIPAGMIVRHKCDVPACCNPDHLQIGTLSDNVQDSIKRGRFTIPPYAPPMSPEAVEFIRNRIADGWKDRRIAEALGVARQSVGRRRRRLAPTNPPVKTGEG